MEAQQKGRSKATFARKQTAVVHCKIFFHLFSKNNKIKQKKPLNKPMGHRPPATGHRPPATGQMLSSLHLFTACFFLWRMKWCNVLGNNGLQTVQRHTQLQCILHC